MGRPKGSKNKPKLTEIPQAAAQATKERVSHSEMTEAVSSAQQEYRESRPSARGAEQPTSENRAVIDLTTGAIIGPDKSIDLNISGREYYSHSFIKTVAQCSAQAYFKSTNAPQRKAFALERGSCVHTLLEAFAKEGKDPVAGLPEMWKLYILDHLQEMSEADQEKAEKEYDNTLEMLTEFVSENAELFQQRVRPEDVEVEFSVELPLRLGNKHFSRTFYGKVDLVLWNSDRTRYRILDYKTVQGQPSDIELALDTQFSLYQYAMTQKFGKPPTHMDFYMLKGVHLCKERFSAKSHPRRPISARAPGCEVNYAFRVPLKTDEEMQELFNAYYAPVIVKYEAGIVSKEGRADVRNRCNLCTFFDHCKTVREFPAPRIV